MKSPAKRHKRKTWLRRRPPPGSSPGQVVSDPEASPSTLTVIAHGPESVFERGVKTLAEVAAVRSRYPVVWLNVDGLADSELIRSIGEMFGFHQLALEDVVNVHQRPKIEDYDDHLFVVLQMLEHEPVLGTEQLSLFLGKDFVVTFQERPGGDCLDPVRDRIRRGRGRHRSSGADYLAYSLIDAVVDNIFPLLERFGDQIDRIEQLTADNAAEVSSREILSIRQELSQLRRMLWPLKRALDDLVRDEHPLIRAETLLYLRDCADHAAQAIDGLEITGDMATSLMDFHQSRVGNEINQVMQVLTIIATIFIPLTFIAGVYGMNFDASASPWNMPELRWYLGYPLCLSLMAVVALALLAFFRRKRWL